MDKTVVALFDNGANALAAREALTKAGFADSGIDTISDDADDVSVLLTDRGVPEDDARYYAKGVERGGTVVAAQVEEEQVDQVVSTLENHASGDRATRRVAGYGASLGAGAAAVAAGATAAGMSLRPGLEEPSKVYRQDEVGQAVTPGGSEQAAALGGDSYTSATRDADEVVLGSDRAGVRRDRDALAPADDELTTAELADTELADEDMVDEDLEDEEPAPDPLDRPRI